MDLSEKKCRPCSGEEKPLKGKELEELKRSLTSGWEIESEKYLKKSYKFKNFKEALAFTNKVGEIAESEGHHPDIFLTWGKVDITFWTHKIHGLSESDFIMAAKCDKTTSN